MLTSKERAVRRCSFRDVSRAFSLAELVTVLGIIAAVSAVSVPRFTSSIAIRRVEAAARRIAADLEYARRHAMTTSDDQEVQFAGPSDPGYTLIGLTHLDNPGNAYTVGRDEDLHKAEGVLIDFGGDLSVIFDMYGRPDSAGTAQIRVGGHTRTISLDAETGRASVGP